MSKTAPGRPKDHQKREAILATAQRLFWEQGWDYVSTEAIAKAAGVSKVTIFNAFGSKIGLLEALIERAGQRFEDALADNAAQGTVAEQLNQLGQSLLPILLSEEIISLEAILTPLAHRHPSLVEKLNSEGPGKTLRLLSDRLSSIFDSLCIDLEVNAETVETLVGLWQGGLPDAVRMGMRKPPDRVEIAERVHRGTDFFLRGIGKA